jgi:hypothetical protein
LIPSWKNSREEESSTVKVPLHKNKQEQRNVHTHTHTKPPRAPPAPTHASDQNNNS